jgi:hypothetical protein
MAFSALSTKSTGDPVTTDYGNLIKTNLDDHETRLAAAETSTNLFRPIEFTVIGRYYDIGASQTAVAMERINFGINILSARIMLLDSGSAGTLQIDIQKSAAGGGAFSSIFSTKPSLTSAASDYDLSTNQVLSTTTASTGDILRLDIDTVMTGNDFFKVIIEIEKS